MNLLLPMTIVGLLVTGMGVALLGTVKVALAGRLNIDEARVGGLVSLFGFTMIPVILSVGFMTDLLGRQGVLIGGALVMAVALVLLAKSRSYLAALVAVLLLSAGWSAQINVLNVLTPTAFGGSKAFALNLGNFFFGLGAFLTPLTLIALLHRAGFTRALLVLTAVVLLLMVLAMFVDFEAAVAVPDPETAGDAATDAVQTTEAAPSGLNVLLGDPIMWLCAFALFFYGPLEASMAAWTTTLLGDRGASETQASGLLSGFWLAFMASRLLTAFTLPEDSEAVLILGLAVISAVVLAGVVASRTRGMAAAAVIAAGFVFGPIFPTIMAVLLDHFEEAVHGRAVGLLFAVGGIGWTLIPMLIGAYARRTSVQRGFVIAVASAVGLGIVAVGLMRFV